MVDKTSGNEVSDVIFDSYGIKKRWRNTSYRLGKILLWASNRLTQRKRSLRNERLCGRGKVDDSTDCKGVQRLKTKEFYCSRLRGPDY